MKDIKHILEGVRSNNKVLLALLQDKGQRERERKTIILEKYKLQDELKEMTAKYENSKAETEAVLSHLEIRTSERRKLEEELYKLEKYTDGNELRLEELVEKLKEENHKYNNGYLKEDYSKEYDRGYKNGKTFMILQFANEEKSE